MDGEAGKKLEAGRKVTILTSAGAPGQAAVRKQTPGMTEEGLRLHCRR